jgi:methyltransferase-like protein
MLASNYAPAVDEALNRMGRDIIEIEQYMDFLRNRLFRQTLLCHRGVKLNRALGPWSLEGFHVAASLRCVDPGPDLCSDQVAMFRGHRDLTISTSQPVVKTALTCLAEAWPQPILFDELVATARSSAGSRDGDDSDRRLLGAALLNCFTKGLCELHVHAQRFVAVPGDYPRACPLARLQAIRGNAVTNRRHERVFLDNSAQRLLPCLDGEHGRESLLDSLTAWIAGGNLILTGVGDPTANPVQFRAALDAELEGQLASLGRRALLVG